MGTLRQFSEKERNYHAYQARQNFLREQKTIQIELEDEREAKLQALIALQEATEREQAAIREKQAAADREQAAAQREQAALREKQEALAEIERLKALLENKPSKP